MRWDKDRESALNAPHVGPQSDESAYFQVKFHVTLCSHPSFTMNFVGPMRLTQAEILHVALLSGT